MDKNQKKKKKDQKMKDQNKSSQPIEVLENVPDILTSNPNLKILQG